MKISRIVLSQRKMKYVMTMGALALTLSLVLTALPTQASTSTIIGTSCNNLGTTQMSDDKTGIIACMLNAPNSSATDCSGGCSWKSGNIPTCSVGQVLTGTNAAPACKSLSVTGEFAASGGSGNPFDSGKQIIGSTNKYIFCALTVSDHESADTPGDGSNCIVGIDANSNWYIEANGQAGAASCAARCLTIP